MQVKAVRSDTLSTDCNERFVLVDVETGEIVDDAQGYGYKSKQKAYACWAYKNRDKSKDAEKAAKIAKIRKWLRTHKAFVNELDQYAFEIYIKKSWGPDDKVDAKFVEQLLEARNLHPEFSATDLL